jgi:2'-5' RNA ligase
MIYLNKDVTKQLISEIDENDLYNDNSGNYGLELKPHVTCLYGIHDGGKYDYLSDSDKEDIFHICRNISGDIKLHNVSLFINDNFEVLKFDVENDSLFKINKKLSDSFKNSNYYPDYHPHVTISYLKPGTGEKYVKLFKELELNVKPESIVYSSPDRKDEKQNL